MIEPIRDLLYSSMQSDQLSTDQRWIVMLRKQLKDAEVEIAAQLATTTVSLGQILKMKTGDIIPIDIPDKMVALVDDVPLMECRYGQQGGQYALKIDRFMDQRTTQAAVGEINGCDKDIRPTATSAIDDDWAAAMAEQAMAEVEPRAQPAQIFPSFQ
jgi:flagellar motor switch protein FliM